MKRLLRSLAAGLWLLPTLAAAVDYSLDSATYLRFQQSAAPGFDKKYFQSPATQYLTLDAAKLGTDGLSLHFYGWGDALMGSTLPDEDRYTGNLTYLYLQYRLPVNNARITAGRQFVFDGLASEQIDGVSFRTDLPQGLTLSAFGGAPTKLDYAGGNKGDTIVGGRVSSRLGGIMELGLATLYEGGIRTSTATEPLRSYRQLVGGDLWLSPLRKVELSCHTFYDLASSGIAENSYLLTLRPADMLSVSGDYTDQNPKNYFAASNIPSLFNPAENHKLRRYGATVTLAATKGVELSADYHRYNRETQGNSTRAGFDLRAACDENRVRTGFSYHWVEGGVKEPLPNAATRYNEVRGYALYDAHRYVLAGDAIAQLYNNGQRNSFELLASAGYRFIPRLLLSGDISYGQNPDYNSEVKGLIKLVYNFTTEGKGADK